MRYIWSYYVSDYHGAIFNNMSRESYPKHVSEEYIRNGWELVHQDSSAPEHMIWVVRKKVEDNASLRYGLFLGCKSKDKQAFCSLNDLVEYTYSVVQKDIRIDLPYVYRCWDYPAPAKARSRFKAIAHNKRLKDRHRIIDVPKNPELEKRNKFMTQRLAEFPDPRCNVKECCNDPYGRNLREQHQDKIDLDYFMNNGCRWLRSTYLPESVAWLREEDDDVAGFLHAIDIHGVKLTRHDYDAIEAVFRYQFHMDIRLGETPLRHPVSRTPSDELIRFGPRPLQ